MQVREFTIDRTPPGSNDKEAVDFEGTTRSLRTLLGKDLLKASWQAHVIEHLEALDLPRPIPCAGPLHVFVTVRFRVRRGQERENFRGFIMKVLGDALIGGHPNYSRGETRADRRAARGEGWIADDKDHLWEPSFDINRDRGEPVGTTVRLLWEPLAEQDAEPVHREVYVAAK